MIKNRIRELRTKTGYSQAEICGLAGINQGRWSMLERGYIWPTKTELIKLKKFFKVKKDRLYPNGFIHANELEA